jgi:outer membrane protein assembly factor BamB
MVIDRKNGRVLRQLDLEHGASSAGATDGMLFYAGTAKGWYYAVSLQQGLKVWTLFAGDAILSPLECANGMLYAAAADGSLHTARAGRTENELQKKALGGRVSAPMYVDSRGCFVPCEDNFLYAFSPELTQRLWDHPFACRGPLRQGVQVGERTVFQRADRDRLYAINVMDGQERWSLPEGLDVLAVAGGDVYVRAAGNRLLQVDEILGTVKASASLGSYDLFAPNATDGSIYAAWRGGRLACLRPLSAGRVTLEMLRKTQP